MWFCVQWVSHNLPPSGYTEKQALMGGSTLGLSTCDVGDVLHWNGMRLTHTPAFQAHLHGASPQAGPRTLLLFLTVPRSPSYGWLLLYLDTTTHLDGKGQARRALTVLGADARMGQGDGSQRHPRPTPRAVEVQV